MFWKRSRLLIKKYWLDARMLCDNHTPSLKIINPTKKKAKTIFFYVNLTEEHNQIESTRPWSQINRLNKWIVIITDFSILTKTKNKQNKILSSCQRHCYVTTRLTSRWPPVDTRNNKNKYKSTRNKITRTKCESGTTFNGRVNFRISNWDQQKKNIIIIKKWALSTTTNNSTHKLDRSGRDSVIDDL